MALAQVEALIYILAARNTMDTCESSLALWLRLMVWSRALDGLIACAGKERPAALDVLLTIKGLAMFLWGWGVYASASTQACVSPGAWINPLTLALLWLIFASAYWCCYAPIRCFCGFIAAALAKLGENAVATYAAEEMEQMRRAHERGDLEEQARAYQRMQQKLWEAGQRIGNELKRAMTPPQASGQDGMGAPIGGCVPANHGGQTFRPYQGTVHTLA